MDEIKNKHQNKFKSTLLKNQDLIIAQFKNEWRDSEKALVSETRKKQLIKFAKDAGVVTGKGILALLLIGGVLTVAAMTPNIFSAFGRSLNHRRYFDKKQFNKEKRYLKRYKLIEIKEIDNNIFETYLTEKGKHIAIGDAFKSLKIKKLQKDGYWRVVMFDIPKKFNWARDAFRQKLRMMGFHQLQESVFILSYPCEKEVALLTEILNIVDFVHLIKTKDFLDNKKLKEAFA